MRPSDGDGLTIEGVAPEAIHTPGHTDDSYSFVMADRVFTGDTPLIRGAGRTDFQNGDPRQAHESIFGREHGVLPGSLHAPYPALQDNLRAGGLLDALAKTTGREILFHCAFGERSAMAVQAARDAGISARHARGGMAAWKKAEGPAQR